jgi:hypothetical protein
MPALLIFPHQLWKVALSAAIGIRIAREQGCLAFVLQLTRGIRELESGLGSMVFVPFSLVGTSLTLTMVSGLQYANKNSGVFPLHSSRRGGIALLHSS